jgi:hypothetical protein
VQTTQGNSSVISLLSKDEASIFTRNTLQNRPTIGPSYYDHSNMYAVTREQRPTFEDQAPLATKEPTSILTTCLLDVKRGLFWASTPIGLPIVTEPNDDFKQFILAPKEYALSFLEDKATLEGWEFWIDQRMCKGLRALKIYAPTHKLSEVYSTFLCGITDNNGPKMSDYDLDLLNQIKKRKEEILTENLKIKYSIPVDCEMLRVQLQQFRSLTTFIFGIESPILACIDPWLNLFQKRSNVMRDAIRRDKTTCAKILTVVDTSVQNFLASCRLAGNQEEIDFDCLSPREEIRKVLNNRILDIQIPSKLESLLELELSTPAIAKSYNFVTSDTTFANNHANNAKHNKQDHLAKKQKWEKPDNQSKNFVANENANPEMVEKFASNINYYHTKTKDIPKVNNTEMCVKYHLTGGCSFGKACSRARSHTNLSKRQESDLKMWLDKHEKKGKD